MGAEWVEAGSDTGDLVRVTTGSCRGARGTQRPRGGSGEFFFRRRSTDRGRAPPRASAEAAAAGAGWSRRLRLQPAGAGQVRGPGGCGARRARG